MPEKPRSQWDWRTLLADEFTRNGKYYYAIAYSLLRDGAAAEDVCQQAFLKAIPKRSELRNEDVLQSWMAQIVVNESLAYRRHRSAEERALTQHVVPRDAEVYEDIHWEMREAVLKAVEALPDSIREVVIMRMLEEKSGTEVSRALKRHVCHVSRQLHAGMVILRETLDDWKTTLGIK
jgi:RNA polymerase sigma-70 factor (ECF subfamily)